MAADPTPELGVLIARAWREDEFEIRVRVMHAEGEQLGLFSVRWFATPEDTAEFVAEWLRQFESG